MREPAGGPGGGTAGMSGGGHRQGSTWASVPCGPRMGGSKRMSGPPAGSAPDINCCPAVLGLRRGPAFHSLVPTTVTDPAMQALLGSHHLSLSVPVCLSLCVPAQPLQNRVHTYCHEDKGASTARSVCGSTQVRTGHLLTGSLWPLEKPTGRQCPAKGPGIPQTAGQLPRGTEHANSAPAKGAIPGLSTLATAAR